MGYRAKVIILLLSNAIFFVVIYLFMVTCPPHLPKFSVNSVTLSNFNLSSTSISGDYSVGFSVVNPSDEISLSYSDFAAQIFYGEDLVSLTRLLPFHQAPKDRTALNATFSARDSYVGERVACGINFDRTKGVVRFDIKFSVKVFRGGAWVNRLQMVRVVCEHMDLEVSSSFGSGKLVGGTRECSVSCECAKCGERV